MANSVAFEPVQKRSGGHAAVVARTAERSADGQARRPRPAPGVLRLSQVPVPGETRQITGSASTGARFGADFSQVPVHASDAARAPAAQVGACVFSGLLAPGLLRPSQVPVPGSATWPGRFPSLAPPVRQETKGRLGADFSGIRVHTDGAARASATEAARACPLSNHLVISGGADKGSFKPSQAKGTNMGLPDALKGNEVREKTVGKIREDAGPKRAGEEGKSVTRRRSERLIKQEAEKAAGHKPEVKPALKFESKYKGTKTQELSQQQDIKFEQNATLEIPEEAHAPRDIEDYYEFRQFVKDRWCFHGEPEGRREWEQDESYEPPYSDAVITKGKSFINFHDVPGFSTTEKVPAGSWLNSYDVYFQWKVRHVAKGDEWTSSPAVHHHMEAMYNQGNPVNVKAEWQQGRKWTVDLPDRPVD